MQRYKKPLAALLILLLLFAAWLHVSLPAESDKGWLLHAARMWLQGRKLYVDIIEINPPLIIWFYALPVWVSMQVPGVNDYEALGALGLCFVLLSVWTCSELMRRHPAVIRGLIKRGDFALLIALVMILFTTQLFFFDREHIFMVMTFPYIVRFMPSLARQEMPRKLSLLVGSMASFGFLIKPHTVAVFAILQLIGIVRERSLALLWSLENRVIYAFSALYLCIVLCWLPDYVTTILPMALATYSKFGNKGVAMLYLAPFAISVGLVFSEFRAWHKTPYRQEVYYLIGVCAAFFVYAKINNGWGYTYNPLLCLMLFTTTWMLWEYSWLKTTYAAQGLPVQQFYFGIRGCLIVLIMNTVYMVGYIALISPDVYSLRRPCAGHEDCWRSSPFMEYAYTHDIRSFGTISYDFSNWIVLMRLSGASWDTRFNHLWMLPQLIDENAAPGSRDYWILQYAGRGLAADLNQRKPQMMVVDDSPGFMGHEQIITPLAFLDRVPEFHEAWRHYRLDAAIDTCKTRKVPYPGECRYTIYRYRP